MKGEADIVAPALISVFLKHSYIPSQIISDLGTAFTSHSMSELVTNLEIKLRHCTLKTALTIELLKGITLHSNSFCKSTKTKRLQTGIDTLILQYSYTAPPTLRH